MKIIPQLVWITGLSGAGKTTVAIGLQEKLSAAGYTPLLIDGDEIREVFDLKNNYGLEDRTKIALSYAKLCKLFVEQGHIVICSTISLYEPVHRWRRDNVTPLLDVYLEVPIEELERRDAKGLYRQADQSGDSAEMVGKQIEISVPESPHLVLNNWGQQTEKDSVLHIFEALHRA